MPGQGGAQALMWSCQDSPLLLPARPWAMLATFMPWSPSLSLPPRNTIAIKGTHRWKVLVNPKPGVIAGGRSIPRGWGRVASLCGVLRAGLDPLIVQEEA